MNFRWNTTYSSSWIVGPVVCMYDMHPSFLSSALHWIFCGRYWIGQCTMPCPKQLWLDGRCLDPYWQLLVLVNKVARTVYCTRKFVVSVLPDWITVFTVHYSYPAYMWTHWRSRSWTWRPVVISCLTSLMDTWLYGSLPSMAGWGAIQRSVSVLLKLGKIKSSSISKL